MHLITVVSDPANIGDRLVYAVDEGTNLAAWLIDQYGHDGFTVPTEIYKGYISPTQLINHAYFDLVNIEIKENIFIIHRPLGIGAAVAAWWTGLALGTQIAIGASAALFAASIATFALMEVPKLGGSKQGRRSPNNALLGQTNIARPQDRVPEIFGTVRSWPDLINPTESEYIEHVKRQTEYMCVGRGFFELQEFKAGETLFSELSGSSFDIYEPGQYPATVLKTRRSNEVGGQDLHAEWHSADVFLTVSDLVSYNSVTDEATITLASGSFIHRFFKPDSSVELSQIFVIVSGETVPLTGTHVISSDFGTGSIMKLQNALSSNANWAKIDGLSLPPELNVDGTEMEPEVFIADRQRELGPFSVPGDNNHEVWIDLQCPQGLAYGEELNELRTVTVDFTFEQITEEGHKTGISFIYPVSITDYVKHPRFYTFKVGEADGLIPYTRWQVTGRRTSDTDDDSKNLDKTVWSRLAGIEEIAQPDDTGTTRLVIVTQATERVAAIKERKFNAIVTRKTVWWDGVNVQGNMETGEGLRSTRRTADSLLHYLLDPALAARTLSAVDVNGIYEVQARLDAVANGHKGEFSYTFDDKDSPAIEEMRQIAQAARCFLYREGTVFGITRDEAQPVARGLFNRRNKKPDAESKTVRFNKPLDTDGVQLEYNDIETGDVITITLPDDLPPEDPHYYMPQTLSPLKIETTGIRQWAQAWDRAQYEFRRQLYQRTSVETTVTADGLLLPLNARIQHTDGTRLLANQSDGEITRASGRAIRTSQRCEFVGTAVYSVILRDENGTPSEPIKVSKHPETEFGFILEAEPDFRIVIRGTDGYQRGTLYNFGPDGNELAEAYIVQRKTPDGDGNVKLELINYDPECYAADNIAPPPRPA